MGAPYLDIQSSYSCKHSVQTDVSEHIVFLETYHLKNQINPSFFMNQLSPQAALQINLSCATLFLLECKFFIPNADTLLCRVMPFSIGLQTTLKLVLALNSYPIVLWLICAKLTICSQSQWHIIDPCFDRFITDFQAKHGKQNQPYKSAVGRFLLWTNIVQLSGPDWMSIRRQACIFQYQLRYCQGNWLFHISPTLNL